MRPGERRGEIEMRSEHDRDFRVGGGRVAERCVDRLYAHISHLDVTWGTELRSEAHALPP